MFYLLIHTWSVDMVGRLVGIGQLRTISGQYDTTSGIPISNWSICLSSIPGYSF